MAIRSRYILLRVGHTMCGTDARYAATRNAIGYGATSIMVLTSGMVLRGGDGRHALGSVEAHGGPQVLVSP
eukprot:1745995-Rhodomonas_salina.1